MYCPLKFNRDTIDYVGQVVGDDACQCEKIKCQFWERYTDTCGLVTDGLLKGRQHSIDEEVNNK